VKRPCLDCRKLFVVKRAKQSRCYDCAVGRRAAQPPRDEPWRRLYHEKRWHRARTVALARDGGRCRAYIDERADHRCPLSVDVQVHHNPPLEQLWRIAGGDYDYFVDLATEPSNLYTLCRQHHAEADALRRRNQITRSGDRS